MAIIIKSNREIDMMRQAGRINALALAAVAEVIRPGVTTRELDRIAEDVIRSHGAVPAFKGYPNATFPGHPYPATINASVNAQLVHGVPGKRRLEEGEIVSIDCGTQYQGFIGDSAVTIAVGHVSNAVQRLLDTTRQALEQAIEVSCIGNRFGDVSATIEELATSHGYSVPREYTGHGVGRAMHEEPQIPNWGKRNRGAMLKPGMTFALEPMLIAGAQELKVEPDFWTVTTQDGSLCAHFEHTILVTDGTAEILTVC